MSLVFQNFTTLYSSKISSISIIFLGVVVLLLFIKIVHIQYLKFKMNKKIENQLEDERTLRQKIKDKLEKLDQQTDQNIADSLGIQLFIDNKKEDVSTFLDSVPGVKYLKDTYENIKKKTKRTLLNKKRGILHQISSCDQCGKTLCDTEKLIDDEHPPDHYAIGVPFEEWDPECEKVDENTPIIRDTNFGNIDSKNKVYVLEELPKKKIIEKRIKPTIHKINKCTECSYLNRDWCDESKYTDSHKNAKDHYIIGKPLNEYGCDNINKNSNVVHDTSTDELFVIGKNKKYKNFTKYNNGFCKNEPIRTMDNPNINICFERCLKEDNCDFISFDKKNEVCNRYSVCEEIDNNINSEFTTYRKQTEPPEVKGCWMRVNNCPNDTNWNETNSKKWIKQTKISSINDCGELEGRKNLVCGVNDIETKFVKDDGTEEKFNKFKKNIKNDVGILKVHLSNAGINDAALFNELYSKYNAGVLDDKNNSFKLFEKIGLGINKEQNDAMDLSNKHKLGLISETDMTNELVDKIKNGVISENDLTKKQFTILKNGLISETDMTKEQFTKFKNGVIHENDLTKEQLTKLKNGLITENDLTKEQFTILKNGLITENNLTQEQFTKLTNGVISKTDFTQEQFTELINGVIYESDLTKEQFTKLQNEIISEKDLTKEQFTKLQNEIISEKDFTKEQFIILQNGIIYESDLTKEQFTKLQNGIIHESDLTKEQFNTLKNSITTEHKYIIYLKDKLKIGVISKKYMADNLVDKIKKGIISEKDISLQTINDTKTELIGEHKDIYGKFKKGLINPGSLTQEQLIRFKLVTKTENLRNNTNINFKLFEKNGLCINKEKKKETAKRGFIENFINIFKTNKYKNKINTLKEELGEEQNFKITNLFSKNKNNNNNNTININRYNHINYYDDQKILLKLYENSKEEDVNKINLLENIIQNKKDLIHSISKENYKLSQVIHNKLIKNQKNFQSL